MTPTEYVQKVLLTESNTFLKKGFFSKLSYEVFKLLNPNSLAVRMSNPRNIRLLHGAIGICTEVAELFENLEKEDFDFVNLKEENSDILWYCGVMIDELKFDPNMLVQEPTASPEGLDDKGKLNYHVDKAVKHTGLLQDLLKKHIFYGKPMPLEKIEAEMVNILKEISAMSVLGKCTIEESMISNIEKLSARYGKKFSENKAINRDLATERKILEK